MRSGLIALVAAWIVFSIPTPNFSSGNALARTCTCVPAYDGTAASFTYGFDIPGDVGTADQRSAFITNTEAASTRWNNQFSERTAGISVTHATSGTPTHTIHIDPNWTDLPEVDSGGDIWCGPEYVTQSGLSQARVIADMQHELGHDLGYHDADPWPCADSIMGNDMSNPALDFTSCDITNMFDANWGAPGAQCNSGCTCYPDSETVYDCQHQSDQFHWDYDICDCLPGASPLVIDLEGTGFQFTSVLDGVQFDLLSTGTPVQAAWTALAGRNAFLALDRNGNGTIDDSRELFGNITDQPDPGSHSQRNGFAALAVYDLMSHGGNDDGKITSADAIFPSLRLWIDDNHDGVSQPWELHDLPSLGVSEISLNYTLSKKADEFGNKLRYRGHAVVQSGGHTVERPVVDVFFLYKRLSPVARSHRSH